MVRGLMYVWAIPTVRQWANSCAARLIQIQTSWQVASKDPT